MNIECSAAACVEERTFLRGMLARQTEQVKLLTHERQQKERHSPTLWALLWHRKREMR